MKNEVMKELATRLSLAARDRSRVSGLTHNFYRYPARFSPMFAATAIECFSEVGDLVLDPYMGGGTTIVETLAMGRRTVGNDLNSLATFVAKVKTTLLDSQESHPCHAHQGRTQPGPTCPPSGRFAGLCKPH